MNQTIARSAWKLLRLQKGINLLQFKAVRHRCCCRIRTRLKSKKIIPDAMFDKIAGTIIAKQK